MFAHIRSFKLAAVLAAVTLFSSAGVASAAAPCGSHDAVAKSLTTKFKEARRIIIVANTTLVLSTDSDLFKFLKGMAPHGQQKNITGDDPSQKSVPAE